MSEDEPLEERIVDALRDAPDDASVETIRGRLARDQGIRPATEDIQAKVRALVDDGRIEVVSGAGQGRRYRLVDTDY